jgi:hypothetical protein
MFSLNVMADVITGHALVDFENGSNGDTITATIMTNSTKGSLNWTTVNGASIAETPGTVPQLKINTNSSVQLYTPASINGTNYTGSGTRGMRATLGACNAVMIEFPAGSFPATLSMGFYFRFNGPPVNFSPRDLINFQDEGGQYQVFQIYDEANAAPNNIPYFHTHMSRAPNVGNDVDFQRDTWYWVSVYRAAANGTMQIKFYDVADNYSLLGTSSSTVSATTAGVKWIYLGAYKYADDNSQSVDYDNIIISTNGVYPLGPGGGPDLTTNRVTLQGTATLNGNFRHQ